MQLKKRYIVLALLVIWLVYTAFFSGYDTEWESNGEIAVKRPSSEAHSYLFLQDLNRWHQWLVWSWHPKPKLEVLSQEAGPAALIKQQNGETISKILMGQQTIDQSIGFNIIVGTHTEAMVGNCVVNVLPGVRQHFLKWNCTGKYPEKNKTFFNKLLMRFSIYPKPPFDIKESFNRLRIRVETDQIPDKPEGL